MTQHAAPLHPAACPLSGAGAACPAPAAEKGMVPGLLQVALPRRMVLQHRDGVPVLYHGALVLRFDEPPLAPLAAHLAAGRPIAPQDRAAICPDALAQDWDAALELLLAEGVLIPGDAPLAAPALRAAPAPALPPAAATPRDWRQDAVAIGLDLTGAPIHPAHLEMVIPVFRLAHPLLDADDRQVGEANVFPRALRLDRPTDWQVCTYSGTRHRDDKPMNLTALKAMRAHWPQMMAALGHIRAAFVARAGISGDLTLGQIERLCIAVLSLPTWIGLTQSSPLDPVLSSLFRVTDGLRLVVHQMMFVPTAEPTLPPQARVSAADILDYAERSLSFHSDTGVCAGPQAFIAEFLAVLVHGAPPRLGPAEAPGAPLRAALAHLDAAFDYGFQALAIHAATFAVWPVMADAWARIVDLAEGLPQGRSPALDRLRSDAAEAGRRLVHASYLGQAAWRAARLAAYAEMEAEAQRLARQPAPIPARRDQAVPDAAALAAALPGLPEADARALAAILTEFADRAGAHLSRASAAQARLSAALGRPAAPGFALADMVLHSRLVADPGPRLPFLPDALHGLTGLALRVDTHPRGALPRPRPSAAQPAAVDPRSTARPPAPHGA